MRKLDEFENYIKSGVVKKQSPDRLRSESLVKESEKSYASLIEFVEKIGITETNANLIIKNSYDVIMEIVRAKMFLVGYNSSGTASHQAEVSYLKKLNFPAFEVEFIDQLRYFRNGITYYGKILDTDYANKVFEFLNKILPKLKEST